MIPESHPLQQLFVELIGRHYAEEIGIRDPEIVNYVAHLMAEFCDGVNSLDDLDWTKADHLIRARLTELEPA